MVGIKIKVHLASTEMQRVPSLVEEKYLGAAIWVRRPTESALYVLLISSSQFHVVCIGLWVVMVFRARDWVWLVRSGFELGHVQVSTQGGGSQDGGAVSGKNAWVAGRSRRSTTPDASLAAAARLAAAVRPGLGGTGVEPGLPACRARVGCRREAGRTRWHSW